jgi:hypothetical protein
MGLRSDFPTDPYVVLDPNIRWYPGDEMLGEMGYAMLLPPLVHKVRQGVKAWRDSGYAGACETTRSLLVHWFHTEHLLPHSDGTVQPFRWYFAQQEAVESTIWLYEIERARDPYALMKFDSSGRVSKGMFPEDWTRYVLKLATGAGKTKVMSLLMAWCYFHKIYEPDSDLSANFLLIAPNIIVLDRLRVDFDGARVFHEDPVLPPNGHDGRDWQDDFQITVHIQDEIGHIAERGNLFLTNIQRVFEGDSDPTLDDDDATAYFLGKRPMGKTTDSTVDLGTIVREVPDLVVLNDEAHHLHDPQSAWFKAIEDIGLRLRQKGSQLAAQFDLTATPKDRNGSIFVETVSDYPLVEAKAIVSVMVLREGWDVQNVVSLVGLRPFTSKARILPEQTLGRGLRRMFRGEPVQERVSVIGTDAFMDFVESIKVEGVELEYQPMGERTGPKSPIVVEVDRGNEGKDIDNLDIELPQLAPRIEREYKNLDELDVTTLPHKRLPVKQFSEAEQRQIIFLDLDTGEQSHVTEMDAAFTPNYQNVIGYFTRAIMRDLRLVGGGDILFGKLKEFIENQLFEHPIDINDLNILRNLSEIEATRTLMESVKTGVNALTVHDSGTTEVRGTIKLSRTRPYLVKDQAFVVPKKSIFSKVVGDSGFELQMAAFFDACSDIISFVKNSQSTGFRIEYQNADGGISNYYPDFIVKRTEAEIWIVETKGREDLDDPLKWERLKLWCEDASAHDKTKRRFHALFVRQEDWEAHHPKNFDQLVTACG